MTIPDMERVPGLKVKSLDVGSGIIEISTKNIYRFYSYAHPYQFDKYSRQVESFCKIISLFYDEFGY
jgi:hypothetical protein